MKALNSHGSDWKIFFQVRLLSCLDQSLKRHGEHVGRSSQLTGHFQENVWLVRSVTHMQTERLFQSAKLLSAKGDPSGDGRPSKFSRHLSTGSLEIPPGLVQVQRQLKERLLRQLLSSRDGRTFSYILLWSEITNRLKSIRLKLSGKVLRLWLLRPSLSTPYPTTPS